jgi:hypothetical protein
LGRDSDAECKAPAGPESTQRSLTPVLQCQAECPLNFWQAEYTLRRSKITYMLGYGSFCQTQVIAPSLSKPVMAKLGAAILLIADASTML